MEEQATQFTSTVPSDALRRDRRMIGIMKARRTRRGQGGSFRTSGQELEICATDGLDGLDDSDHRHGPVAFVRNIADPRSWLHVLRIVHYYSYSHVRERPKVQLGPGAKIAPNVSLRNGERISIGARSNIGARASLWAGDETGRITIGSDVMLAPQVFVIASNYQFGADRPIKAQARAEADIEIGDDVWLGAGVIVVAGVSIADGCVIGAGSVVTRSLPKAAIAAGCPARVVGSRGG